MSESGLNLLLDELLHHGVINHDEKEFVKCSGTRSEKARSLIDMVQKKGNVACSRLITALREHDKCLSAKLKLI